VRGDPKTAAQQGLCRGSAQQNHDFRFVCGHFGEQPGMAGDDLGAAEGLVDTPHADAAGEIEMLDGVGDVESLAVHPGCGQCLVQQPACRPYERPAPAVHLITGLLADQHDVRPRRPFTEYRLLGIAVQIAAVAGPRGLGEPIQVVRARDVGFCAGHGLRRTRLRTG
jgi:hypothetical protein